MAYHTEFFPASSLVWQQIAQRLLARYKQTRGNDFSDLQVIVPTFEHAQLLKAAMTRELKRNFIPPRINTLFALLEMQVPQASDKRAPAASQRLMNLYGGLRQHAWLKKLFSAKRNTDLLPLAQTLLNLSDELTLALLPTIAQGQEHLQQVWHTALAQMPVPSQSLLSDEAQLVWTIWQSQLDADDANVLRFQKMLRIARAAQAPLIWISPTAPSPMEQAFLQVYQRECEVWMLDWRPTAVSAIYAASWPHMLERDAQLLPEIGHVQHADVAHIKLCPASSLEDEATQGAQTIIEWLQQGKQELAVIAQDRVVARRIRALLERAQIFVADETGWKLSTTRAAAAIAALFEVVSTRADTMALLDLLKSPYLWPDLVHKSDQVMCMELALRRANVLGGWDAALDALTRHPEEQALLRTLLRHTGGLVQRRSLADWGLATTLVLDALGMKTALQEDLAGKQILQMLAALISECQGMSEEFSFSEWRALLNHQFETTPFKLDIVDKRVVMLPLNGARLRKFDAVLLVGADAVHLPSPAPEVLFFSNAVRRECGLDTRELRQSQQMRDLCELFSSNDELVLSWQSQKNGEHQAISPWLEQLDLNLERNQQACLQQTRTHLSHCELRAIAVHQAQPQAPHLLPEKLSASAYASLMACPYQFFASRMLRLSAIDELSDMPEKSDYGQWLHRILKTFHETLSQQPDADREQLLRSISTQTFATVLQQSPAALGYAVRWENTIPAYIEWVSSREQEGWHFVAGEESGERSLQWDGGAITLHGRIDRVDQHSDGRRAILDYKTRTVSDLRRRLQSREDQQLAFYGLLTAAPADTANYVALEREREKIGDAEATDFIDWTQALQSAISENMRAIQEAAPLPAQGSENVCRYCDMRGLCRKGAW